MKWYGILLLLLGVFLGGCDRDPGLPSDDDQTGSAFEAEGFAAPLTDEEFSALTPLQQYQVANKFLNTMYKGYSLEEFFTISGNMDVDNLSVAQPNFISEARTALATDLTEEERATAATIIDGVDENGNTNPENAKYVFDEDKPRQLPLARMYEYKLSRDSFDEWIAYFLANTIMFSPALEMESTGIGDVQNISRTLVSSIKERRSVRQIIRSHLPTLARWRVSRSPENHALEAYELYLGLFETEEDSRRGGIACKEWFLTDADDGYQLVRSDEVNTEPQIVLENYFVTSCNDLYDVIAGHPLLMPRVTEVIINHLMPDRSTEDRLAMVEAIIEREPETFEDIFTAVLFSREYLLNTERVRKFEETAMGILDAFNWDADKVQSWNTVGANIFRNAASRQRTGSTIYMGEMGWSTMSYKIGRNLKAPTDALSFANYHRALRENIMREFRAFFPNVFEALEDGDDNSNSWDFVVKDEFLNIHPQDYLNYWFLTTLGRYANADEVADLMTYYGPNSRWFFVEDSDTGQQVMNNNGGDNTVTWPYWGMAILTLDYISRLPEFYYFKAIN